MDIPISFENREFSHTNVIVLSSEIRATISENLVVKLLGFSEQMAKFTGRHTSCGKSSITYLVFILRFKFVYFQ